MQITDSMKLDRLSIGICPLTENNLEDITKYIEYSQTKNYLGKIWIAIRLFFSGKGLITLDKILSILETHPLKQNIFDKHPNLRTLLKTYSIGLSSLNITQEAQTENRNSLNANPSNNDTTNIQQAVSSSIVLKLSKATIDQQTTNELPLNETHSIKTFHSDEIISSDNEDANQNLGKEESFFTPSSNEILSTSLESSNDKPQEFAANTFQNFSKTSEGSSNFNFLHLSEESEKDEPETTKSKSAESENLPPEISETVEEHPEQVESKKPENSSNFIPMQENKPSKENSFEDLVKIIIDLQENDDTSDTCNAIVDYFRKNPLQVENLFMHCKTRKQMELVLTEGLKINVHCVFCLSLNMFKGFVPTKSIGREKNIELMNLIIEKREADIAYQKAKELMLILNTKVY